MGVARDPRDFDFLYIRRESIGYIGYDPENAYVLLLSDTVASAVSELGEQIRDNREYGHPLGAPLSLEYYPSFRCDLACPYCYVRSPPFRDTLRQSFFDAVSPAAEGSKPVERKIAEYVDSHGVYQVHILGGEPFLYDGLKRFVMRILKETRAIVDITSNGTVDIPSWFIELKRKFGHRLILNLSLQGVSLDVFSRLSGLSGKIAENLHTSFFENLDLLASENIPVSLSSLIVRSTLGEIDRHAALVKQYDNVVSWVWKYPFYYDTVWFRDEVLPLSEFFGLFKKYAASIARPMSVDAPFAYRAFSQEHENLLDRLLIPCPAGIRRAAVLPNGDVYGCLLLPDSYMGNLLRSKIRVHSRRYSALKCDSCSFSELCTGCPAFARLNGLKYDNRCPYAAKNPTVIEYSDDLLLHGWSG